MKVAEQVALFLQRQGVERIFGLCGGHIQPIWDAVHRLGIQIVDARSEMAAAPMAQASGELTDSVGVALVHGGTWVHERSHSGRECSRGPAAFARNLGYAASAATRKRCAAGAAPSGCGTSSLCLRRFCRPARRGAQHTDPGLGQHPGQLPACLCGLSCRRPPMRSSGHRSAH